MSADAVRCSIADGVATVVLDRPEQRNRLDLVGLRLLEDVLLRTAEDETVRVVVLTGTGPAFCSGADLSGAADGFADDGPRALVRVLTAMLEHPRPIVARVQGHVAGGGNGLVAAADIAVAAASARFAFSEVRVGVAPAVISVVCLQVMGRRDAQELLLTGERVDADRAQRAGLVTVVVPDDGLDAEVRTQVERLTAGGPEAVRQTKELLRRVPSMPIAAAFDHCAEVSAALFSSDEAREGMTAFLEKRSPAWNVGG